MPLFKAVDEDLAVGVGVKFVTAFNKPVAKLLVIVDFTVKGENLGLVLVVDRLVSCVKVDNGKPAKAH